MSNYDHQGLPVSIFWFGKKLLVALLRIFQKLLDGNKSMPETALRRIDIVNRFLQMNSSKDDELQQIVQLAANICNVSIAMITFIDSDTQHVKYKVGTDINEVPYQDTICKYTIKQKELFIIPNAALDERVMNNPFVINDPYIRFYAGSPLTSHDDQNFGTLCVFDRQPKILTTIQEKMLNRLARQVTRLLEFDASFQLLKEQYEASLIEETKLRSFFESSGSCHLLLDTRLRVLSFNSAMVNVLMDNYQLPIEEGMEVTEYVEPAFMEEFIQNCKSALLGELTVVETTINSPKGNIPWNLTFEPAFDLAGTIIGVTYSATDITETVRHEKTVLEQRESLRQIDRILSAELSQPMKVIKNAMATISQQGYPDDLIEFKLLEKTCSELEEKGTFIISPESASVFLDTIN